MRRSPSLETAIACSTGATMSSLVALSTFEAGPVPSALIAKTR